MPELLSVSAFPYNDWPWGGEIGELQLFANFTWTDIFGTVHPGGRSQTGSQPYQHCPLTINGNNDATILSFLTPPTMNAVMARSLRITGMLADHRGRPQATLFRGWRFPTVPNPIIYPELEAYNLGRQKRLADHYLTEDAILALFDQFQGSVLPASDVILGSLVLDRAPANPALPEAVGINSLVVPHAYGVATLVAGAATTILSAAVTATSPIKFLELDEGITGKLRAINRVAGVSFDVISDNGADAGDFVYYLFEKP